MFSMIRKIFFFAYGHYLGKSALMCKLDEMYDSFDRGIRSIMISRICDVLRLNSVEYIFNYFSMCLKEDIRGLQVNLYKERYFLAILRNMIEQIIECSYLLKHPETIHDYLGDDKFEENEDLMKSFKQFRSKRGREGCQKKSIRDMCEDIETGEKAEHPFYDMYSWLSENEHNTYYVHLIEDVEGVDMGSEYNENLYNYLIGVQMLDICLHKLVDYADESIGKKCTNI